MNNGPDDRHSAASPPSESSEDGSRSMAPIRSISAVTLATHDMARALRFYLALGFPLRYGGESAQFSSLAAGEACLNLIAESSRTWSWWGRIVFHVADVDALFARAIDQGLRPDAPPCDATWGERYFHITDPDGHELSFAVRLPHVA
jgi:catechol 2,3-dioxygenase-like lactoylglutathione lyase family enzyme